MAESDEQYTDEETDHLDPNIRAELRKSRERAKALEAKDAEIEALKRDNAFTKAGIPDTGVGALLRKAYDGENDPEAIRKTAAEYGIDLGGANAAQQPDPIREELETHRQIAGSTGTSNSGPTAEQALYAAILDGANEEAVMEIIRSQGAESGLFAPGTR